MSCFRIGPIFINFCYCQVNWQHILFLLNQTFYNLRGSSCGNFKVPLVAFETFLKKTVVCKMITFKLDNMEVVKDTSLEKSIWFLKRVRVQPMHPLSYVTVSEKKLQWIYQDLWEIRIWASQPTYITWHMSEIKYIYIASRFSKAEQSIIHDNIEAVDNQLSK